MISSVRTSKCFRRRRRSDKRFQIADHKSQIESRCHVQFAIRNLQFTVSAASSVEIPVFSRMATETLNQGLGCAIIYGSSRNAASEPRQRPLQMRTWLVDGAPMTPRFLRRPCCLYPALASPPTRSNGVMEYWVIRVSLPCSYSHPNGSRVSSSKFQVQSSTLDVGRSKFSVPVSPHLRVILDTATVISVSSPCHTERSLGEERHEGGYSVGRAKLRLSRVTRHRFPVAPPARRLVKPAGKLPALLRFPTEPR